MNSPVRSQATLETGQEASGKPYLEFLREPIIGAGLSSRPVGVTELQQSHTEDEVDIVLERLTQIQIGKQNYPVKTGDIFAPAEYSRAACSRKSA
jgi:gentisate 1,2-dioxygenase